jgi:hypothetical protein
MPKGSKANAPFGYIKELAFLSVLEGFFFLVRFRKEKKSSSSFAIVHLPLHATEPQGLFSSLSFIHPSIHPSFLP